MLKKFVVATLACLTIFLSRRALTEPNLQRGPSAQTTSGQVRTASAL